MTLSYERLSPRLHPRPVRFFEQIASTNDEALRWLRAGAPVGAVVIADEQLRGRGRKGRTWHTPPGVALAVSVVLRPPLSALHQVSMLGALAIAELADFTGCQSVSIKWPNDVQVAGRKLCGVLPEAAWDGERLLGVALGMGVNVRVDFGGTPLEQTAISLETALGKALDRVELIDYLLARVDYWAARLNSAGLFTAWRQRLNTIGQVVTVDTGGEKVQGTAEAVDEQGALLVRDAAGALRRILAGDIGMG
jgi:BirA family biotin operon repressor/biotin-[acetyl-CoA-carboxylase] ligase